VNPLLFVSKLYEVLVADLPTFTQKHKNNMSGAEFQRTKEAQAAIMQEKQRKGLF
jgi:hypothetical protein